ncbi:hypothetical protein QCD60_13050 [Pokkaliibacter sp. MBI-7]|uniref:hypothetical protein n=1 Tax=Pokkaliibacter sp. MBI-7 TaxID=3040600 RepID=UPI0024474FF3|nr:hypothetical protein [Pokkaliibacter sp. MBI-7]MDH2433501.1 hypothetical protein [Pokkaliibacter sp. MBI-7]
MQFIKDGEIYKIARITGSQDNILGVCFSEDEVPVEIISWSIKKGAKIKSSPTQVLNQVLSGLEVANSVSKKKYHLSKIYFLPSDAPSNSVYKLLTKELINRIDKGLKFSEI